MGNTNLPQFGAADTADSRDTLEGDQQLTDEQRKELEPQSGGGLRSLLPDSVANETGRVVEHADHGKNVIERADAKSVDEKTASAADLQSTDADRRALAGHVDTGHSPSDATFKAAEKPS